jgi:uncharacterized integral membrane protein
MLHTILVIALVVAILAVVFALQNSSPVVVSLLAWRVEINLALLLLITFTLGVLTSLMVSVPAMLLRWRKKRRKAQGSELGRGTVPGEKEQTQPASEDDREGQKAEKSEG